jgi:nucleotide-binding universal stress UspA family protein
VDFNKILCPVDFSEAAHIGIRLAASLASEYGADLALLHVVDYPSSQMETVVPLADLQHFAERMRLEALAFLEDLAGKEIPPEIRTECLTRTGVPYRRIVEVSEDLEADLIVMPSRNLTRVERWFLGSTVERVVRLASCPVLTVPPDDEDKREFRPRKIICPTDFSSLSYRAFPYALSLAKKYDAVLTVMHVVTVHRLDPASPAWRFSEIPMDHVKAVENAAARELDRRGEEAKKAQVRVETRKLRGSDSAAEIIRVSEDENADLVVMATHGHTGLLHGLVGSTAERVVRLLNRPVLTIRPTRE